jgi:5-methylcytosine-specific restriction endonuclease McrA
MVIPMTERFRCEHCGREFRTEQTDDEAHARQRHLFPETEGPRADDATLCDACFDKFWKWFSTLTEEEKLRIRVEGDTGPGRWS